MGFSGDAALADFEAELARQRECVRAFGASFQTDSGAEAILQLFLRHQPQLLASPETRSMMETLAEQFAREIEASPDLVLALNNLDRFVRGARQPALLLRAAASTGPSWSAGSPRSSPARASSPRCSRSTRA